LEVLTDLSHEDYIAEIEPGSESTGRFYLLMETLSYYSVIFAALNEGGEISATVDESEIETGAELPEGTTVQFNAYPKDGYEIEEWIINGVVQEDITSAELTFNNLQGDLDVKVSFKDTSTQVEEEFADDNLNIYIFENRIVIIGQVGENAQAELYDMLGRKTISLQLNAGTYNSIDIDGLKIGVYLLHITDGNAQTIQKLLID